MLQENQYLGPFETAAQVLGVDPVIVSVHSDAEIETAIDALGQRARAASSV